MRSTLRAIVVLSIGFFGGISPSLGQQPTVVPGVPLMPATRVTSSGAAQVVAQPEIVAAPNQAQSGASDPSALEAQQQQKIQLLTTEPFARDRGQLLQSLLLGSDVAFALRAAEAEPQPVTPAQAPPPPRLGIPGQPPPPLPASPNAAQEKLQAEVVAFRRDVALGNWGAVKDAIAAMSPANAKQVYEHLLNSMLSVSPNQPQSSSPPMQTRIVRAYARGTSQMIQSIVPSAMVGSNSNNYLTPTDVLGIADAAPNEPTESQLTRLAQILNIPIQNGFDLHPFVAQLKTGTRYFGGAELKKQIAAAKLLLQANQPELAGEFLPPFESLDRSNVSLLKAVAQRSIAMHDVDGKPAWLQQAWECFQAIVGNASANVRDRSAALESLVLLAPKVKKEVGQAWLDASFADRAELGRFILSLVGAKTANGMLELASDSKSRLEWLRLQTKALEALLGSNANDMSELQSVVTLMAMNWLKESQTSINSAELSGGQAYMQIDMYGNYYWVDPNQAARMNQQSNGELVPIALRDLIEIKPSQRWVDAMDASLQLAIPKMLASMYLKVGDERDAFPCIEQVAATDPLTAQHLVDEFLTTWTANHDPNNDQRQRNPYIYFYGFEQRAETIPLTRSKQERNLAELSEWVARIRKLPIEKVDENKLAQAFTACHSSAEVFRLDAIEKVFGKIDSLKPETVATICQSMRVNLATVWRAVRNQEEKQTRRKEPEIQQEVLRGYDVAAEFATRALAAAPENWQLTLALACLAHDKNDYAQSVKKSSEYSVNRLAAFDQFALAARRYAAAVGSLEKEKQSTDAFDYWFYAALGAVDLGRVTDETVAAQAQYPLIRQALLDLPGEVAEKHMADFANNLFTRMSPLKPEMKFRYLSGGFEIVGDHSRAVEARKLFQYYQDLLSEIKLVTEIDGSDVVGHEQPFGVFVNIYHTHEIEREAGGFAKYVQNQNSMYFAYNYGRPNEDYRDKFEKTVREDLAEHFEVLTVTFVNPKSIHSRPARESGWRVTPYAYLLLKPKGPQVDKLPTVKLNLDFLDTSGYMVMPISSPVVPIDASQKQQPRPYADLNVTQTLDERQAREGKLILEVKATAKGLVPELDQIMDLNFAGFDVKSVEGQPVLASEFDPDTEEIRMLTDRSWTVELGPKPGAAIPQQFQFAAIRDAKATAIFQRYRDADLAKVDRTVDLEKTYAKRDWSFLYWLVPLGGALLLGLIGLLIWAARRPKHVKQSLRLPQEINPFTVLALLKHIKERNGIAPRDVPALEQSIVDLETFYFGQRNGHPEPDLHHIARSWVAKSH
jgi:hypothetical protein